MQFQVYRVVPSFITDVERTRQVSNVKLNDNWSVVCATNDYEFASIEIHRVNMAGEFSVSGELKLKKSGLLLWEKTFSRFIKTESALIEIDSNINLMSSVISHYYTLHGIVNISYISDKQDTELTNGESKKRIQLKSLLELSNDFEQCLAPKETCFADVTLKCGGASIRAHKCILSARSPVFAAMFAHPMKENLTNEVDITDIDEPILRAMLTYIYTGKTSDLTSCAAADLLSAADKYQLQDLKTVCSYSLKGSVSFQNVWRILVLGDLLAEDLKSFALDYICNKCGKFSAWENTEEWKALRNEKPALAMDVLASLVKSREEKL
ncbi:Speckle-type POZ protein-like B [Araneus ventricosus]|uniref:Speckle-type POZ protein-like B n=1 Tax=Araneus ventricosus TaxID=182803 RepID=A0A4Y2DGU6_ARAVE|nr:Speckle-type POZ protein-like B [Araneus ventricosus]